MNITQRRVLKRRFRTNVRFRKAELKRLTGVASRFHMKKDRCYKAALSNIKKEIRFYNRLGLRVR